MNLKIVKNLNKIAENNIDKRLSIEIQRFDSISFKMQMITYCGVKYDENFVSHYIPLQTKYIEGENLTINLDLNHRVYYKFKQWHCVGYDSLTLDQIGERTYTYNLDVPELPKGSKSGIYKKKFDFYLKDLSSNQRDTIFTIVKFKIIKDSLK